MSVEKIESIEWKATGDHTGDGIIEITLSDTYQPHLLGTTWCNTIIIWWKTDTYCREEEVKLYAVEKLEHTDGKPIMNKIESWYDANELMEAFKYIRDNLT